MAVITSDDIVYLSRQYGIPPELGLAVFGQESSFGTNNATSSRGAQGPMQVMPKTFKAMGGTDPSDPFQNVETGIKYLAEGYRATGGDLAATAMYYHAGPKFREKLAQNPNLSDGSIRTVDYAQQVEARAKGLKPMDADRTVASLVTDAPTGTAAPSLASSGKAGRGVGSQLDDVLEQTQELTSSLLESSSDLGDKLKENIEAQMASLRKQGDLQATVALEKFRLESQRAHENADQLTRLGLNTSDVDSLIAQISTGMVDDFKQAQELRKSINDKKNSGAGMFNILDPIGSIVGEFQVSDDIRRHNQLVDDMAAKRKFVDQATGIAANVAQVNSLKYSSNTAIGAKAAADLAKEQAENSALNLQDKLLKTDFDTQVRTLQVLGQRASMLATMENREANNEIKRDTEQRKKDAAEQQQIEDQRVQVAAETLGLSVNSVKELNKQAADIKAAVERVMASGAGGQIAKDPMEAQEILARGNRNNMAPATAAMSRLLDVARRKAEEDVNTNPQYATANKEQRAGVIRQKMYEFMKSVVTDPKKPVLSGIDSSDGPSNPFAAPDFNVMATNPNASKLKITKILQDTSKALPTVKIDDKLITELALANVGEGKAYKNATEAARDVSDYYKAAIKENNRIFRPDSYGLPLQTSYIVGGVDLADYSKVMPELLQKLQKQIALKRAVENQQTFFMLDKTPQVPK